MVPAGQEVWRPGAAKRSNADPAGRPAVQQLLLRRRLLLLLLLLLQLVPLPPLLLPLLPLLLLVVPLQYERAQMQWVSTQSLGCAPVGWQGPVLLRWVLRGVPQLQGRRHA